MKMTSATRSVGAPGLLASAKKATVALRRTGAPLALFLLLATLAHAQNPQFLFDANGNLLVETGEASAPPQILAQPQQQVVVPGELASFFVLVADTRDLTYQWQFNGIPLSGSATNDALLLSNVGTNNQGQYSVVLVNSSGSVTSAPALLWIDSRGCGMPDSWQLTYFGSLTNLSSGDFDGDGVSNLQEFLDGTNPTNKNSALYQLTVLSDAGTVDMVPDQRSYTNGQVVTLTATGSGPDVFRFWTGDTNTRSNPITLTIATNMTVQAHFKAADFVWVNPAGGDWSVATNWSPNFGPGSNDNAIITLQVTVTVTNDTECASLTLGNYFGSPTLSGNGTLTIHGPSSWTAGAMTGNGRTVIDAGATLTLDNRGPLTLNSRTLENGGTILWTGSREIDLYDSVITNRAGALFQAQNDAGLVYEGGVCRFDNAGTFGKSPSSGTTTVGSPIAFNNFGTVCVQSGTLLFNGGFTNNGAVTVSAGATTRLNVNGSASGTFSAAPTALVEWIAGTFTLNSGAQLNGAGLYRINGGTLTCNTDLVVPNLDLAGGTLNGAGAVTVSKLMNWTQGAMSGTNWTIFPPGATLNINNPGLISLTSRSLENGGTILWRGAGGIGMSSAVITNRASALFQAQNAATLAYNGGGTCRFDNAGMFRKSASTGTTTLSFVGLNNYGTVDVQTGTLLCTGPFSNNGAVTLSAGTTNRLTAGGSASGSFNAAPTALVDWNVGTFTLNSGAQLNGGGLYRINVSAACICNPDLAVTNLDLAGELGGAGAVTVNGVMNWTSGTMDGGGRTIFPAGATLNINNQGNIFLTSRTLENGGTVLWTGSVAMNLNDGVITNRAGALFQAQNATALSFSGGTCRFDNAGTFRKSASTGTTSFSNIGLNNYGTVDVQTGTLTCNGNFLNNGAVTVSAGATHRLEEGGSASGTFTAAPTALVEWTTGFTFTLNPGAQLNGGGLYRVNGAIVTCNTDLAVANLDITSGIFGGTGAVTVNSAMNWTGGTMNGGGRTIFPAGATLIINNPGDVSLTSRGLENGGTVLWTAAGNGLVILTSSVITNRPGALFHAQNAANVLYGGGTCRFDNAGTFRKSSSTGTTTFRSGIGFNNYGMVDLRSGILAANGGYTPAASAVLSSALGGTSPGTGYGQLQAAGTVALNGALNVSLANGYFPATNDSFTVLTAGTRSNTFASFSYPSNTVTMQLSNTTTSVIARVTGVTVPQPILLSPALSGTNVLLTWTTVSNFAYRLEFNPNLAPSNWNAVSGDITAASNTASKLDPIAPSNRFYRVRVLP